MSDLRLRLYIHLDPEKWPKQGISPINTGILVIVLISVIAALFESEPKIQQLSPRSFIALNYIFAIVFSVEYLTRLWVMGEDPRFTGISGRLRYIITGWSLLDLIPTLVLWAGLLFQFHGVYGVLLRLARLLRILSLIRNSEWAKTIRLLKNAVGKRRRELTLSIGLTAIILLGSSTLLFMAEGTTQPEKFGSILRAMWWSIATLTTVGYGDVYPVTWFGQLLAGFSALAAIGIVAMPTGIMAAAFSDAFQNLQETEKIIPLVDTPDK